jgi:PAS domain S-box-containing protein
VRDTAPAVGVLPDASSALVDRLAAAGVEPRIVEDGSPEQPRIECLLVEPPLARAIPAARGARADERSLQIIVALSDPADRAQAERALLFAPGLGEVRVVGIEEVDRALLQRAAEVARQRRGYRRLRRRLTGAPTGSGTRQLHRTRISDAYLAALLEVLGDAVLSVDAEGTVLSWNAAAERILGRTGSEIEGSRIEKLLEPADPVSWRRALRDGESATTAVAIEHGGPGDAARIAEITVTPLNAEDRVRVVVMHDVTEQRRAQIELERQTVELETQAAQLQEQAAELEMMNVELQAHGEALEEALASRSRFYAAMSHELRTPMNAIIGYNALLLDSVYGELPEAQASAVERAQRAARHLLELVNDVLDLAKIEAGRIELQPEVTSIPELLHELSDTVRPLAEEHGSELLVEAGEDGSPSCAVVTDPRRVRQILLNLLSNAVKFGGGRPVRLSCEPVDGGGAVIHVIDQGIGIAPEDQQRIFEEFVQVDHGERPGAEGTGTGLGLPISKRLAGFLCGEIGFTSEPGRGSDFTLRLPAALPEGGCGEARRMGDREPTRR